MGFAWDADELPGMTPAEAREMLRLEDEAQKAGSFGNEDLTTLAYARLLVATPKGQA